VGEGKDIRPVYEPVPLIHRSFSGATVGGGELGGTGSHGQTALGA